jgi:hypothetical protein
VHKTRQEMSGYVHKCIGRSQVGGWPSLGSWTGRFGIPRDTRISARRLAAATALHSNFSKPRNRIPPGRMGRLLPLGRRWRPQSADGSVRSGRRVGSAGSKGRLPVHRMNHPESLGLAWATLTWPKVRRVVTRRSTATERPPVAADRRRAIVVEQRTGAWSRTQVLSFGLINPGRPSRGSLLNGGHAVRSAHPAPRPPRPCLGRGAVGAGHRPRPFSASGSRGPRSQPPHGSRSGRAGADATDHDRKALFFVSRETGTATWGSLRKPTQPSRMGGCLQAPIIRTEPGRSSTDYGRPGAVPKRGEAVPLPLRSSLSTPRRVRSRSSPPPTRGPNPTSRR